MVVPQDALVFETDSYYAFVEVEPDRVERRRVTIAAWNEADRRLGCGGAYCPGRSDPGECALEPCARSKLLVERLSTVGTSTTQQHILLALGKIRDPESAKRLLDFAQAERDPEVRAVAIRVLGDIGDDSVRNAVEKLSESETDPRLKALMQEVVAKMTVPKGSAHGEVKSSVTFTHSEPNP
jgi:hypothetical protein